MNILVGNAHLFLIAHPGKPIRRRFFDQSCRQFRHGQADFHHLNAGQKAQNTEVTGRIAVFGTVSDRSLGKISGSRQPSSDRLRHIPEHGHPESRPHIDIAFP